MKKCKVQKIHQKKNKDKMFKQINLYKMKIMNKLQNQRNKNI